MKAATAIDTIFAVLSNLITIVINNPILAALTGLAVVAVVFGVLSLIFGRRSDGIDNND